MDDELTEQLKLLKNNSKEKIFEEHNFIANSLRIGLTLNDLEKLEYVDVYKIMLCLISDSNKKYRKATAEDWDKLM